MVGRPLLKHLKEIEERLAEAPSELEYNALKDRADSLRNQLLQSGFLKQADKSSVIAKVPMPKEYLKAKRKKIKDAQKISKRNQIRVRFVQGGKAGG